VTCFVPVERDHNGSHHTEEKPMASPDLKALRGAPASVTRTAMGQWPQEISEHGAVHERPSRPGWRGPANTSDSQALDPEGDVRPVRRGWAPAGTRPFAEPKDVIAAEVTDVDSTSAAVELPGNARPPPGRAASRSTSGSSWTVPTRTPTITE